MNSIELNNYRCFNRLSLAFRSNINLIIGDNASGKTTIIKALGSVLNTFFTGYSDEYTRFLGLSKDDFTILQTETGLANEQPIVIRFSIATVDGALELHSKKGRTLQRPLDDITKWANRFQEELFDVGNTQTMSLPLFAAFSTQDIHSTRKLSPGLFKEYYHKPSFGYYECLQGDGFLPYWTKRLLVLKEGGVGSLEVEGVMNAVTTALGKDGCNIISAMSVRPQQGKVYYILSDERVVDTDSLSDGYKRVVNIVVDLAFRCMLLNMGIYGMQACEKTAGTVLIDEVDLHLHPILQSKVLPSLKKAFPQLQFIASTHAPMVMTGIPNDAGSVIYKLDYNKTAGYTVSPIDLYGLDVSSIVKIAWDIAPRAALADAMLGKLFELIDTDKFQEAAQYLATLQEVLGNNNPELIKADAMLAFLNDTDDTNT